jgi:Fe2+ transport system protein FeoA
MSQKRNSKNGPEGRRLPLGEAFEDGLKAIYKLQSSGKRVSTSALAAHLAVTEPTATAMIKRLARLELLHHAPYHGVELTPALLQYLAELGLVPMAHVELLEKAPFGGPIALMVGDERRVVGSELAAIIRVGEVAQREMRR